MENNMERYGTTDWNYGLRHAWMKFYGIQNFLVGTMHFFFDPIIEDGKKIVFFGAISISNDDIFIIVKIWNTRMACNTYKYYSHSHSFKIFQIGVHEIRVEKDVICL